MNESERQKVSALAKRYREAGKFREADAVTYALRMCDKPPRPQKPKVERLKPLPMGVRPPPQLPKVNSVFNFGAYQ